MSLPPELLAMLRDQHGDENEDNITPERAVQQLRDNLAAAETTHTFTAGQIVRPKPGTEDGYKTPRGNLLIYVRDMTRDEQEVGIATTRDMPSDAAFLVAGRDCVVGRLMQDGAMMEFPTHKRYIEPHPDFT